jgi:hypothetical protein
VILAACVRDTPDVHRAAAVTAVAELLKQVGVFRPFVALRRGRRSPNVLSAFEERRVNYHGIEDNRMANRDLPAFDLLARLILPDHSPVRQQLGDITRAPNTPAEERGYPALIKHASDCVCADA